MILADRTINLLVVGIEGGTLLWYSFLSRLYFQTKSAHNMPHMCERCVRSLKIKEVLEEHFQWCARGCLQIEQPPKTPKFSYSSFHKELSPLKVIYADTDSYIQDKTHYPAAIASYEV